MLNVAKYLSLSRALDMGREQTRYFNVSEAESRRAFPLLQLEGTRRDLHVGRNEGWLSLLSRFGRRR
jgi:hypothetical protein